jgi:hypothetical protein
VVSAAVEDTGVLLRRLAIAFAGSVRSGRDDDLWAVQSAAEAAWQRGVRHDDLALLLTQLHLDCHAVGAAADVLAAVPRAAATPTGRMLQAGLLLQRGDTGGAGELLLDLALDAPTWRSLALLAVVYEDVADLPAADLLYAEAAEQLDAKQLGTLAWVECQRARLRLEMGRVDGADQHLRRAESVASGWNVATVRSRWLTAAGETAAAASVARDVAEVTGRPDHAQRAAVAAAAAGLTLEAADWQAWAGRGFAAARRRWPYRYAHHEVDWHLDVDHDIDAAVVLAWADYRQRPARRPADRLAAALRAAGDAAGAYRLDGEQERRRRHTEAVLAVAASRNHSTVALSV